MPKKIPVVQMNEGTWYRVKGYTYTECCDCALTHKEEYRLVDGHLEWRAVLAPDRTEKRRKELGITVKRKTNRGSEKSD
jgi:hypothetical protein